MPDGTAAPAVRGARVAWTGCELGYAAADAVRVPGGAATVSEVTALGLPAAYVPLHDRQRRAEPQRARPVVEAGGGLLVADAECTPQWVLGRCPAARATMSGSTALGKAAAAFGIRDGDERMADLVLDRGPRIGEP